MTHEAVSSRCLHSHLACLRCYRGRLIAFLGLTGLGHLLLRANSLGWCRPLKYLSAQKVPMSDTPTQMRPHTETAVCGGEKRRRSEDIRFLNCQPATRKICLIHVPFYHICDLRRWVERGFGRAELDSIK